MGLCAFGFDCTPFGIIVGSADFVVRSDANIIGFVLCKTFGIDRRCFARDPNGFCIAELPVSGVRNLIAAAADLGP